MKYVAPLSEAEQVALTQLYQNGSSHRTRQRAHCVLLSAQGHSRTELAEVFAVHADTISVWLNAWQQHGLDGLADAPKPGRPRKLDSELDAILGDLLQNPTPQLRAVVEEELQKKTSRPRGTP